MRISGTSVRQCPKDKRHSSNGYMKTLTLVESSGLGNRLEKAHKRRSVNEVYGGTARIDRRIRLQLGDFDFYAVACSWSMLFPVQGGRRYLPLDAIVIHRGDGCEVAGSGGFRAKSGFHG